ncbi:MAG: hypothetical protein N2260_09465 [Syntrophobacterales bacterium]|nr:hypothetical protein [Syntrophobacterales bacterium]
MDLKELLEIAELSRTYRAKQVTPIWHSLPKNWREQLEKLILSKRTRKTTIFFRADDIGVPSVAFNALCRIFKHFNVPLALSVVPSWLNTSRINYLFQIASPSEDLWSWHQHGWRHTNWEKDGKKSEFGSSRNENQKWQDLWKGFNRMKEVLNVHFVPVFTPPWNRVSPDTFRLLSKLGFKAVSTDQRLVLRKDLSRLKNFRIYLDLHTQKVVNYRPAFDDLLENCRRLLMVREPAGIMIHHNRMNLNAFLFLANFLEVATKSPYIAFTSFKEMLNKNE